MASQQVGSIHYDLDLKTDKFDRGATEVKSKFSKVGAAAKVLAKSVAVVGAAATAAFGAFVIKGGIDRALNIEDAQAKLKGLGHDVKSVEKIMGSALKSVKGTAFGLGDAATTAASAVAAGIKPGKELTKYLTLTADAATIAGIGVAEMGSIMNKVTTSGKAMTDNLNQLSDRGIPIFKWLQEEYKVSAEELSDMVSSGEVDAETFRKVIEKNIGGAALESGSTTRGAWANMKAAMARVGEAIVKDIIPKVRDAFGDMTKWLDDNSDKIVKAFSDAADFLKGLGEDAIRLGRQVGDYLSPKLKALWNTLSNQLVPALLKFWKEVIQPLIPVIGTALVVAIGLVVDQLNLWYNILTPVINFMADNKYIVYAFAAAFVAVRTAMAISKAVAAFQAGTTAIQVAIASTKVKLVAFRLLAMSPVSMGALGVGAALASIAMVYAALQQVRSAIRAVNDAANATVAANSQIASSQQKAFRMINSGDAKKAKAGRQLLRDLTNIQRFKGGPVSANNPYLVGENRDGSINDTTELFVPRSAGKIVSSSDLQSALTKVGNGNQGSNNSSNINVTLNMDGIMTRSRADLRYIAKDMVMALNEELQAKGRQVIPS